MTFSPFWGGSLKQLLPNFGLQSLQNDTFDIFGLVLTISNNLKSVLAGFKLQPTQPNPTKTKSKPKSKPKPNLIQT